jgi:serine/threonine-protein kinase
VKVLDFGLAKSIAKAPPPDSSRSSELTLTGAAIGSPFWMSPEQVRSGPIDERTDVWGVGATLYYLLCGVPPFMATTLVMLTARILSDAPAPIAKHRADVSPAIEAVVMRCLAKQASARFAKMAELSAALRAARIPGPPPSIVTTDTKPLARTDADTSPMSHPPFHVENGALATTKRRPARKR